MKKIDSHESTTQTSTTQGQGPRRRLALHRDTLALLGAEDLEGVIGGGGIGVGVLRTGTWGRPPDTCAAQHCS